MTQRVQNVMSRKVLYVTPEASVRTAMELLRNQQLDAVPVVADGRLLGVVEILDLYRFNGEFPISEALDPQRSQVCVAPDASVVEGAALMLRYGVRQLPVVRDGELVGLLSDRDLAVSWGSAPDGLTGLPWQDEMRRWATRQLVAGREITVLFVDLNNFGAVNKAHGHVYADRILQQVAHSLRDATDPERDFLCRYGGDEFAIASIRSAENAQQLAGTVRDELELVAVNGTTQQVGAAVGLAGGNRNFPRPGAHPSATLDDLITLASQASTQAKQLPEGILVVNRPTARTAAAPVPENALSTNGPRTRVVVDGYTINRRAADVAVTVHLRLGEDLHEATSVRSEDDLDMALAIACADCLTSFAPAGRQLHVEAIRRLTMADQDSLLMAIVAWQHPDQPEERLVGASLERSDRHRAVINAVLDATNRRFERWAAQVERGAGSPKRSG